MNTAFFASSLSALVSFVGYLSYFIFLSSNYEINQLLLPYFLSSFSQC
ncbi:protein of unknown function [Legionella fallonii LLAP-10]|uniref:Uncharacterized protein n=1 Tax=Legionella fallonii LLAP-10 TaxID=1212491 RepID=A0A098G3I1_9GAMM|nr:protein of unknown function [Legionella fallonii LLAP-10]